jgi:DNA polymerase-1
LLAGSIPKVTHNGAFDLAMLRALSVRVEQVLDTMLIEQVLRCGRDEGSVSLAALAERDLGVTLDKGERLTFASAGESFTPAQLEYARRDVIATYQLFLEQVPRLSKLQLEGTARLECEAVGAFADLRYDGIHLDQVGWKKLVNEAEQQREASRREIEAQLKGVVQADLFGRVDINFDSDGELREVLAKLLKRPVREVNKQVLKGLEHPIGEALLRYRESSKIASTYGQSFLESVHPRSGRIHAHFQQIGAPTGRVSCRDPNLQNIPRGSRFRQCFSAPPGRRMVTADYSGCELRILAEVSGDQAFIQTFRKGGDLHAIVASEIFGVPVSKETNKELRDRAKAINFGLAYGMGAGGLAQVTGVTIEEAERLLNQYFRAFPAVQDYLESAANTGLHRGWAQTIGGRRLILEVGDAAEGGELSAKARVAKNMPIQGTNADMLKVAMAGIRRRLLQDGLDGLMVNSVHDEILLEASEGDAWDVAELARQEMIKAGERYIRSVPVVVDVGVGEAWQK